MQRFCDAMANARAFLFTWVRANFSMHLAMRDSANMRVPILLPEVSLNPRSSRSRRAEQRLSQQRAQGWPVGLL